MVIFLFSTYNYGKTRTKFENLNTPSCSAHPSGPRFVNNWNGLVLLLASVIINIDVVYSMLYDGIDSEKLVGESLLQV